MNVRQPDEVTYGDPRYWEVYEAIAERAQDRDIVAEALLGWGVYTAVGAARKRDVWTAYLVLVDPTWRGVDEG